jgi:hypothetical protein
MNDWPMEGMPFPAAYWSPGNEDVPLPNDDEA